LRDTQLVHGAASALAFARRLAAGILVLPHRRIIERRSGEETTPSSARSAATT